MECPECGFSESKVTSTIYSVGVRGVLRKRECLICGKDFYTVEVMPKTQAEIRATIGSERFRRKQLLREKRKFMQREAECQ